MDVNKITLVGRLLRKPKSTTEESGQPCAEFTLATNYAWRDEQNKQKKDETELHRVVVWGKLAEIAATYLDKGSRIYVEGRLQTRHGDDKDGNKRYTTEIKADRITLLGGGAGGGGGRGGGMERGGGSSMDEHEPPSAPLTDDDIPF